MNSAIKGFTLLELMIAILLFAMVSSAAYKLFVTVTKAQQVTDGIFEDLDVIQRARLIIEKDLFQLAPRPIRDEFGDRQAAVVSPTKSGAILEFTREGWRNPLKEVRSNMQRVAYYLEDGSLIRSYWPMLDRAPDPVPVNQLLLSNVERVKLRFLDEKKRWRYSWPPEKKTTDAKPKEKSKQAESPVMPVSIEMTVTHSEFGDMVTVLPLLDFKESDAKQQVEPGDLQQNLSPEQLRKVQGEEFDDQDFDDLDESEGEYE